MKRMWALLMAIIICLTFVACGNSDNGKEDDRDRNNGKETTEEIEIENRSDLIEIMGGVLDVDFDTLWIYHYKLTEPYYICGYVVPNSYYDSGFVLGDEDYSLTYPTIDVMDYHYSESDYEEGSFLYIKALPNGDGGVFLRDLSKTQKEDEYLSVEEYCSMSETIHNTYFEITGFIGSINEEDDYWTCTMYESKEAYKNDDIDWGITLLFDEYPSNINGTNVRVVGKYSPISDEPWLLHCSIIED